MLRDMRIAGEGKRESRRTSSDQVNVHLPYSESEALRSMLIIMLSDAPACDQTDISLSIESLYIPLSKGPNTLPGARLSGLCISMADSLLCMQAGWP